MKPGVTALLLISLQVLLFGPLARGDFIGTFDEDGNGKSVDTVTGLTSTISGTNGVDPFDPGNGLKPLIYNLGINELTQTDGDLVVTDPGSTATSDVFRFFTDTATSQSFLIVYSQVSTDGSLADVGIPGTLQENTLSLTETTLGGLTGLFNYTPAANQPGFVDLVAGGGEGNLIYNLISDSAVPEPASVVLLGVGLATAVVVRRLRRSGL
jgi:hypothetical protein